MWPVLPPPPTITVDSVKGMKALERAHPLFSCYELLAVHIFSKVRWEDEDSVKCTCKKWNIWWKLRHVRAPIWPKGSFHYWAVNDILYNDGRDYQAWMAKDMTVYFNGFPLLFKED